MKSWKNDAFFSPLFDMKNCFVFILGHHSMGLLQLQYRYTDITSFAMNETAHGLKGGHKM